MTFSEQIYDKLKRTGIIGATGETYFELNNIKTIIRDSSIVGNVIQEWLKTFMDYNGISFRIKENSQEFPDFLLNSERDDIDLLEVKCFQKSPNFDVANFLAYARSLRKDAYRINSDYLIFEYINLHGGIVIKNIWLKKVWEICGGSDRSELKIQWKQGNPVNIRPTTWYSNKTSYPPFKTRLDFIKALAKVVNTNATPEVQKDWLKIVSQQYKTQTGDIL
jgi:hypothetical protein